MLDIMTITAFLLRNMPLKFPMVTLLSFTCNKMELNQSQIILANCVVIFNWLSARYDGAI